MRCKVVFSSRTGNTEKLARAIYDAIDFGEKDIERLTASTSPATADLYFVGFWIDRGSCSIEVMDFLDSLRGKKVILFGTCGTGQDELYYHKLTRIVSGLIPEDNDYLGTYLCQGKMPISARHKYEAMLKDPRTREEAQYLLQNFDEALLHPDEHDFACARLFVKKMLKECGAVE